MRFTEIKSKTQPDGNSNGLVAHSKPHYEIGRAKSQLLLWVTLGANNLAKSRSFTQLFQTVPQSLAMHETSHNLYRAEHSSSNHEVLQEEYQRVWASWPALYTPDEQLGIMVWSSDVLVPQAKKSERASEEARLIANSHSKTERLVWIH